MAIKGYWLETLYAPFCVAETLLAINATGRERYNGRKHFMLPSMLHKRQEPDTIYILSYEAKTPRAGYTLTFFCIHKRHGPETR
jgi:hypothetical protein